MFKRMFSTLAFFFVPVLLMAQESAVPSASAPKLRVALIVQNHIVQKEYQSYLPALADLLTSALSNAGLSVINPANVFNSAQNATPDNAPTPAGIASNLNADYFITASLRRVTKKTVGLKPETSFSSLTMGLTLTIATSSDGAAFASQDLALETPMQTPRMLENNLEDIFHNLLEDTASRSAEWLTAKLTERKTIPGNVLEMVAATFSCNVPGAILEIDGVAVGTVSAPVSLNVPAGLHTLRVSYPFFIPAVFQSVFRNGSNFSITLELSDQGYARWQDKEKFLAIQKRLLDSGATDDYVRRALAEGNAESLKNSHFKWDGALQTLTITKEDQQPIIIGPSSSIIQQ